jgi:hypothetical protein
LEAKSLEISVAFVEKSKIHSFPSHPPPDPPPLCVCCGVVVAAALVGEGDGDACGLDEKLPVEEEDVSIEEMKFNVPFLFLFVVVSFRSSMTPAPWYFKMTFFPSQGME